MGKCAMDCNGCVSPYALCEICKNLYCSIHIDVFNASKKRKLGGFACDYCQDVKDD